MAKNYSVKFKPAAAVIRGAVRKAKAKGMEIEFQGEDLLSRDEYDSSKRHS